MNNTITLNSLFHKLIKFRRGLFYAMTLYFIWSIIEISIPFLTQIIIDEGIKFADYRLITIFTIAIILFNFSGMLADFSKTWMMRNIGVRVNLSILEEYFNKLIRNNFLFFNTIKEGKIIQNVNDNLRIELFLASSIISFANAIIKLSISIFVLFYFHHVIALIFICSLTILIIWDISFLKTRAKIDKQRFNVAAKIQNEVIQSIQGIFDIKVNHLENRQISNWHNLQQFTANIRLNILKLALIYKGGANTIHQIRDGFILFIACNAIIQGQMTIGTLVAIQYILSQANQPATDILQGIQDRVDAKLSLERLNDVLAIAPTTTKKAELLALKGDLEIKDVSFTYPNSDKGVSDINLLVPQGTKVAIIGESGNGKSTLFKLILGLIEPRKGHLNILTEHKTYAITQNKFGSLSQDGFIFDANVLFNITLSDANSIDYAKLDKVIDSACLREIIDNLPEKLDTVLSKNLSKGQMQRILIARALYVDSNFLILDEPTSALDNKTAMKIIQNILAFNKTQTILIATHQLFLSTQMDVVWVMDSGKIINIINQNTESKKDLSNQLMNYYEFI